MSSAKKPRHANGNGAPRGFQASAVPTDPGNAPEASQGPQNRFVSTDPIRSPAGAVTGWVIRHHATRPDADTERPAAHETSRRPVLVQGGEE